MVHAKNPCTVVGTRYLCDAGFLCEATVRGEKVMSIYRPTIQFARFRDSILLASPGRLGHE